MSLINENVKNTYNLDVIGKGWLLYGKHITWDEGKSGIITSATQDKLVVQFYPNIENVTNHYMIPVNEVVDGQWVIRWSKDLSEVMEYEVSDSMDDNMEESEVENNLGG